MKLDLSPFFAKGAVVDTYTDDAQLSGTAKQLTLKKTIIDINIPENGGLLVVG